MHRSTFGDTDKREKKSVEDAGNRAGRRVRAMIMIKKRWCWAGNGHACTDGVRATEWETNKQTNIWI